MPVYQYDRQQLLDDVWSTPVTHLTQRYELSDAGLKKLCSRLQIPTPPRGYWAKLKAGKKVPAKPTLVPYTGSPSHLVRYSRPTAGSASSLEAMDPRLACVIDRETDPNHKIVVPARLRAPHQLVRLTQDALSPERLDQREQPLVVGKAIHLHVSKDLQARALRVADALLKALDKRGYETYLDDRGAAFDFHGIRQHFEFYETCSRVKYEMTEADVRRRKAGHYVHLPTWSFIPSGVLTLQTYGGYGPKVKDGKRHVVEDLLNTFLVRIATDAVDRLRRQEEHKEKAAEYARRRAVWQDQKERQDAERARLEELETQATRWERAERLRNYLRAMENAVNGSGHDPVERQALIDWGRAKADWLDPLVARPDDILDEQLRKPGN